MFKKIINTYFAKNSFAGNVATLTTGTVIAQVFSGLLSPVLSRLYSPDDYGLFALFQSLTGIIAVIITARYEMAIVLPKEDKEAINILSISVFFTIGVTILTLLAVIFLNTPISYLMGNVLIGIWLYFLPLSIFLSGVYQVLNYWSNRKDRYKAISVSKVTQSVTTSSLSWGMGIYNAGVFGLVISSLIGQIFSTISLFYNNIKEILTLKKFISKENMIIQAKEHKDFPRYSLPNALLDTFSIQLPIIIIMHLYSSYTVGLYSFALKVLSIPISLIAASVGQVFFKKFTDVINNKEDGKKLLKKTWWNLGVIGILPSLIILIWGADIFKFVFGPKWYDAGRIASIIMPMLFFMFLSSPSSSAFIVLRIQHIGLIITIICLICRPLMLYIGSANGLEFSLLLLVIFEVTIIIIYNIIIWKKLGKIQN